MRSRTGKASVVYEALVDDAKFFGQPLSGGEERRIEEKFTTRTFKRGRPKDDSATEKIIAEKFAKSITDWVNVQDEDGKDIPCPDEDGRRKWALLNHWSAGEALEQLEIAVREGRIAQQKNLKTSQPDS